MELLEDKSNEGVIYVEVRYPPTQLTGMEKKRIDRKKKERKKKKISLWYMAQNEGRSERERDDCVKSGSFRSFVLSFFSFLFFLDIFHIKRRIDLDLKVRIQNLCREFHPETLLNFMNRMKRFVAKVSTENSMLSIFFFFTVFISV